MKSGRQLGQHVYHYSVFFDHDELYVGGNDVVLKLNASDYSVIEVGVLFCFVLFKLEGLILMCACFLFLSEST